MRAVSSEICERCFADVEFGATCSCGHVNAHRQSERLRDVLRQRREMNAHVEQAESDEAEAWRAYWASKPHQWEANPDGLSGRLIRGYRHWRDKR
jgi:hypothetical protein